MNLISSSVVEILNTSSASSVGFEGVNIGQMKSNGIKRGQNRLTRCLQGPTDFYKSQRPVDSE